MKALIYSTILLLVIGCSSTRYEVSLPDFKIGIHQVALVPALVYLERLKGERVVTDGEGVRAAVRVLNSATPRLFVPKYTVFVDSAPAVAEYYDDIGRMFLRLDSAKDLSSVRVGEELRNRLGRQSTRYNIVLKLTGLSRDGGVATFETIKSVFIAIITFGSVVSVPVKPVAVMSVAIVDQEEGRVIYFDKVRTEDNPTNSTVLEVQLRRLFKTFLK